ncbi:hypothetical protein D3C75_646240 [compost metagenome]
MAKLSGQTGEALVYLAVDNNAAANTGSQRIADTILYAASRAAPGLAQRSHIGVIVYFDWLVQATFQNGTDRHISKSYVRRKDDDSFTNIRKPGQARSYTGKLIPRVRGVLHNLTHILFDIIDDGIDAIRSPRRPLIGMQQVPFGIADSNLNRGST